MVVLVEDALVDILARVSLRSIARVRSVCKEWKSIIDSDLFRVVYELRNSSSSVSWSIMNTRNKTLPLEVVGHYGCERWELTKSLGSSIIFMPYNPKTTLRTSCVLSCTDGLVLLYSENIEGVPMYHVGNPLLGQWARIPLPPHLSGYYVSRLQENIYFSHTGLVTKMEKGIAVGYKVVSTLGLHWVDKQLTFMIYSSETGLWEPKKVRCPLMLEPRLEYSVPLNGILHWLSSTHSNVDANYVVSFDFYNGDGDELSTIPFPDAKQYEQRNHRFKRTITTSAGSVMYCNVFNDNGGCTIRIWRLVKYCNDDPIAAWKLSWELNTNSSLIGFGANYFPVVMHPLNSEIIYLWSRNKNGLVMLNLRTHKFSLHKDKSSSEEVEEENKSMDGCIMRLSGCKEYMDSIYSTYLNVGLSLLFAIRAPSLAKPAPETCFLIMLISKLKTFWSFVVSFQYSSSF